MWIKGPLTGYLYPKGNVPCVKPEVIPLRVGGAREFGNHSQREVADGARPMSKSILHNKISMVAELLTSQSRTT